MSIRQLAEQDLLTTLEDVETGFGWPLILIDPRGVSVNISGQSHDISQAIDPDTGVVVSGRECSVVIRLARLRDLGIDEPDGEARTDRKPWLVQFEDVNGNTHTFKVDNADPDRTLGTTTLSLSGWTHA